MSDGMTDYYNTIECAFCNKVGKYQIEYPANSSQHINVCFRHKVQYKE